LCVARIHALVYDDPTSAASRAGTKEANIISALIRSVSGARARTTSACRLPAVQALLAKR
jgi:hypothetical protein